MSESGADDSPAPDSDTDDLDQVEVLAGGGGTQLAPGAGDPFDADSVGPWPIHGIAMPEDRTMTGGASVPTYWPQDVLEAATPLLDGKDLVTDQKHDPDEKPGVREVIGAVTGTEYLPDHGIGYEGEIDDREIAQKIARGRLDASPYLYRTLTDETRADGEGREGRVPEAILGFDNLAVVRNGAGGDGVAIQSGERPTPTASVPGGLGSDAAEALSAAFPAAEPESEQGEDSTDDQKEREKSMSNDDTDPSDGDNPSEGNDPDPTVESLQKENRDLRARLREHESETDDLAFAYAEALAQGSPFEPGELVERYSFRELREKADAQDVVETLTPAPRTRDPDPTGENRGESGEDGTAETLSRDEAAELDMLRKRREALSEFATEDRLKEIDAEIETLAAREQQ